MEFEGKWDQLKGRLKETWGDLTDDDLRRAEGKFDKLVGVIKERTGEARDAIERRLDGIAREERTLER